MRVGIGYDIHKLVEGRKLIIGGVTFDSPVGLLGHSDADVLLHAVADALLGAAGLGDIGEHFPDNDPSLAGISSKRILDEVVSMIAEKKFSIANLDCTLFAEQPKIGPFKQEIRNNLSYILQIQADRINVKAKTMEGMGPIGRRKAIAAQAIVGIVQRCG